MALPSFLYISTKYLNHMRSHNRGIDESIHRISMECSAQHYVSFLFVLDRSAPNGAPTFDGRGTLNANEIAATAIASLSLRPSSSSVFPPRCYLALQTAQPFAPPARARSLWGLLSFLPSKTAAPRPTRSSQKQCLQKGKSFFALNG